MTSPASNGTPGASAEPPAAPVSPGIPIPARAHVHCLALLAPDDERPLAETLSRFLVSVGERVEGLEPVDPTQFALVDRPRPCMFAKLRAGEWAWHVLVDPGGMPDTVREAVLAGTPTPEILEAVDEHRLSVMVFLLEAPDDSTPMERFRALARVLWAWLDAGATVVAFPEGQQVLPRRLLLPLEPEQLEPEHCYLFISNGMASQEKEMYWLRTWGMAQFALPDLAAGLAAGTIDEARVESLKLLFETLPPAMIREHGVLPVGGTVEISTRTWTAVGPPGPGELTFMASRFGFQLFV